MNLIWKSYRYVVSRTAKHKKMLLHRTWWGEAEFWQEGTLICAVLGFAMWRSYNEPISGSKLRELYSVFTAAKAQFCWDLIRQAFLLHSKDFRELMIADLSYSWYQYISPKSGSKGQRYVKNFSNIFNYCIMFSDSLTIFLYSIML